MSALKASTYTRVLSQCILLFKRNLWHFKRICSFFAPFFIFYFLMYHSVSVISYHHPLGSLEYVLYLFFK